MDTDSYDIHQAALTPHSVQPIPRGGAGKKNVEPIEFNLTEHNDKYDDSPNLWEDIRFYADDFRLWLATRCCACLSSVPSLALVIIAAVLIMLLIATIPLAFALTYISPQASTADDSGNGTDVIFSVGRSAAFPNESELVKYRDWDEHIFLRTSSLLPSNISSCTIYGFACTGQPHIVISKNRRCDGYADCEDGSDELDCHECQTTLSCPASEDKRSSRKVCLIGPHLCDNHTHCPNNEDETIYCKSECAEDEHKCRDTDICIPREAVCDGEAQCPFHDDEEGCTGECKNGAKSCAGQWCIPKRLLCDGFVDCLIDGSDEEDCDCASCSGKNSALCNGDQKRCIAKAKVCDGEEDCPGGEDEQDCPGVCKISAKTTEKKNATGSSEELVRCADGILYEWKEACNGMKPQCSQSCTKCDSEVAFQCASEITQQMDNFTVIGQNIGDWNASLKTPATLQVQRTFKECIDRSLVCDDKPDCTDGSDEANCDCGPNTMECRQHSHSSVIVRRCYLDTQKCDGYNDCVGGEDERNCDSCNNGFLCQSEKKCIPSLARCDGQTETAWTDRMRRIALVKNVHAMPTGKCTCARGQAVASLSTPSASHTHSARTPPSWTKCSVQFAGMSTSESGAPTDNGSSSSLTLPAVRNHPQHFLYFPASNTDPPHTHESFQIL